MGLSTSAAHTPLLKRLYGSKVAETTYKRDKLLELCKKDTAFRGEDKAITVAIAPTAGGSASFSAAVAAQEATVEVRFTITRKREYQLYTIDNEAIEASKGNTAAIVEILKRQVGGAKKQFDEAIARRAHSPGGGSIGRLPASITSSGTTVSLLDRTDIVGTWYKNTLVDFDDGDGTGTSPGTVRAGGPLKVTAIDRDNATITFNATLDTISGIAANDYVFRYGDFGNAMTGIQGWEPISDPSSSAFFGVDRTADLAKLSGVRVDGLGKPKEETIQDAGVEAQINGFTPKHVFINSLNFKDIGKELGGQRVQEGATGQIGFERIVVHVATGPVTVHSSPFVKLGYFWMGDAENLVLGTAGECPMDLTFGNTMLLPTADARQGRIGCYGNFWVDNPGEWVVGKW